MKFIPDSPIQEKGDDVLGRSHFAIELGTVIKEWDSSESIVIALFGPWGSGKTSVIEMALEQIRGPSEGDSKSRPIILRFNPWHFSGQEDILKIFFTQLYTQIRKHQPDLESELRIQIDGFINALGLLEHAPRIGRVAKTIESFLRGFVVSDQTLEDRKKALERVFEKLKRKIVIVLDDIDRLPNHEIRLLFQLIKLNADLPNTLYLVAFDRKVVIDALEIEQSIPGKEYLEKIVQVAFDVPSVERSRVEMFLFSKLDEIISVVPKERWDQNRWGNLYHSGLKDLFVSLRDVKRFVNSLSFTFQIVPAEVDSIDFIGLEALRVFLPEIYHRIANNKALFTSLGGFDENVREKGQKVKALEAIFNSARNESERDIAQSICMQLFPPIQSCFGGTSYASDFFGIWRQGQRICSADTFDYYFLLGVPQGEISNVEMQEIMRSSTSVEVFLSQMDLLQKQDRIYRFLELAQDHIEGLEPAQVRVFIEALMIYGESLPEQRPGFFALGSDLRVAIIAYSSLLKLDEEDRCTFFSELIDRVDSLFTMANIISHDSPSEDGSRGQAPLFTDECLIQLQRSYATKISEWAEADRLLSSKRLGYLLFRWRQWTDDPEIVRDYVKRSSEKLEGLLNILKGFTHEVQISSVGDYLTQKEWEIDINNLAEFLDPHEIAGKIQGLPIQDFSEEIQRSIRAFEKAYSQWAKRQ